jgi:hypothetical protein
MANVLLTVLHKFEVDDVKQIGDSNATHCNLRRKKAGADANLAMDEGTARAKGRERRSQPDRADAGPGNRRKVRECDGYLGRREAGRPSTGNARVRTPSSA